MIPHRPISAQRYQWDKQGKVSLQITEENLAEESPLSIRISGQPWTITLRSPGDDKDLVMGLLYSEGLLKHASDLVRIAFSQSPIDGAQMDVVDVILKNSLGIQTSQILSADSSHSGKRILNATSSCGLCGVIEWQDLPQNQVQSHNPTETFTAHQIQDLMESLQRAQPRFLSTGGTHGAAAFNLRGELLASAEDIGRHNAVDKVVGHLLAKDALPHPETAILCVSSRVAYEIVAKTHRAGFRYLFAVGAPSDFSVQICQSHGITLAGFCREGRATFYSHPERILV